MLKWFTVMLAACAFGSAICHADEADLTPIADCDQLPPSAVIEQMSNSSAVPICREAMKVLDDVTVEDVRNFEKGAYLLSRKGYEEGHYAKITAELVEIIRLRGQYHDRAQWMPTLEVIWKSYNGLHGAVTPSDVIAILQGIRQGSGPERAKQMTDDDLYAAIVFTKHFKQQ
jgi:hypothetical protein